MKPSKKYPGFFEVETKFKVGDIVNYKKSDGVAITCIITGLCTLADHEDNYEASYYLEEFINGKITETATVLGGAYESEITLNIKFLREKKINKLIGLDK